MVPGVVEHLANETGTLTNVLVHNGAGNDLKEVGVQLASDSPGQQGLAGSRRPVQQAAFGGCDADALEEFRVEQGQLDHLS